MRVRAGSTRSLAGGSFAWLHAVVSTAFPGLIAYTARRRSPRGRWPSYEAVRAAQVPPKPARLHVRSPARDAVRSRLSWRELPRESTRRRGRRCRRAGRGEGLPRRRECHCREDQSPAIDVENASLAGRLSCLCRRRFRRRPAFLPCQVDCRKISSYNSRSVRRRPDTLLPIEVSILAAGVDLRREGATTFYGFSIAKEIREREGARRLTAHGTLYKALDRMERAGLLASCWEDPLVAARERRPRRRLYEVTSAGEQALAKAQAERPRSTPRPAEGLAGL